MDISICLFKYFPYGGLQKDFMQFYQLLRERGHAVRVYCGSWEGPKPDGLDLHEVPVSGLSNQRRNQQFAEYVLADLKQHPVDLVIGFNKMPGLDVYFAADACFEAKAREERSWFYRQMPRYRYYSQAEKAVFSKGLPTKILLISETEKQKFIRYYGTEAERMTMLPPGVFETQKSPANSAQIRAEFRKSHQLSDSDLLLLFVAASFKTKGLDRVFKALAALNDSQREKVQLFVVGPDKPDRYLDLANSLNIQNKVHFFGGIDDVQPFYLGADCLIHPARTEAAGVVLLEALLAGLPILASGVCGYGHHIVEADAGIVMGATFQQDECNAALVKCLDDAQLKRWRENALNYADTADLYSKHSTGMKIIEAELVRKASASEAVSQ